MDICLIIVIAINTYAAVWYFRALPQGNVWVLPFTYFIINHLLQYPLRALYLEYFDTRGQFMPEQIVSALSFATVFLLLFTATSIYLVSRYVEHGAFKAAGIGTGDEPMLRSLLYVMLAWVMIALLYKIVNNRIYALYEDMAGIQFAWYEVVLQTINPLRWFCIFLAYILYVRTERKVYLQLSLAFAATIVVESIITTSKGSLVYLIFAYFITRDLAGKRISRVGTAAALLFALVFGIYSYLARYYGVVFGDFSVNTMIATATGVMENVGSWKEVGIANIFDRFNLLDGLILLDFKLDQIDKWYFQYGSFSEILNFIPRTLWPDRPLISFNHYITSVVWGYDVLSENPIGRVGEAYFALGKCGGLMAFIYPVIFMSLYMWLNADGNILMQAVYCFLMFAYIIPDAYLLYGVTNAVISLAMLALLIMALRFVMGSGSSEKIIYKARSF